jgi:PAS domain S-box-containing protein
MDLMALNPPIQVLHIDDEPGYPEVTGSHLERFDDRIDVTPARSGEKALTKFTRDRFDCVVSDYDMPDKTGLAVLKEIREHDPLIPFILFTGRGSEAIASEAISAGITDYLQKDTSSDQYTLLANRITNAVEQYRTRTQLEHREELLHALFKHSRDWVCVTNSTGIYQFVSPATERLLGHSSETLQGDLWFDYVHADDRDTVKETLEQVTAAEDNIYSIEYRFNSQDDGWRWLETRLVNCLDNPAISGIITNSRDITDRKSHRQQIKTLHTVANDLNTCTTPDEVYELLIDAAENVLEYDLAIADAADGEILIPKAVETASGDERFYDETPIDADDNVAAKAYRTGNAIVVDDINAQNINPADSRYRSTLTVPIGDHGIFQTVSTDTFNFTDKDVELVEILVSHAETILNRMNDATAITTP